jgi:hypothetical protein
MKNFVLGITFVLMAALLAPMAGAQDITRGSIGGVVRDATGAVVADATVTLTSPYGEKKTKTNSLGEYVFSNLNVGTDYAVSVEKPGFSVAKTAGLTVSLNSRVTADVQLAVGTTSQSVEVSSGGTETIDLTSTGVGANLNESLYKNVPAGRSVSSIILFAPGVTDGGGTGVANPSINGASGLENEYIVNGANVTDPGYGGFGTYTLNFGSLGSGVNFDFIQEVQVKSGGFEAQYGEALGGVVNILTKSGSNQFHGTAYAYFQPHRFEAERPDANLLLTNQSTRIVGAGRYDFGGDLGGRIIKDKLFFYGGFNPNYSKAYRAAPTTLKADGTPQFLNSKLGTVELTTRTFNYSGKVNYNLSANHQLEGSVFGDPASLPSNPGFARVTSLTSNDDLRSSGLDYGSRTWTGRYNGIITRTWVVSANYSNYLNDFTENPKFNGYLITDQTPSLEGTGSNFSYNGLGLLQNTHSHVNQFNLTSSHILKFFGSHAFDWGYQFEDIIYDISNLYTGGDFTLPNDPRLGAASGKVMHGASLIREHQGGKDKNAPIVLRVTRGNYSNPAVGTLTRYHAGFVQDSWSIGRRLTIKPGLRFEQQAMAGTFSRYVFAHNWAPRIGIVLDPTGNRKSKFSANWGRFYEKVPSDISVRSFSFEDSVRGMLYKDPGPGKAPDLSASNYIAGAGTIAFSGGVDNTTLVAGGTGAQYQDEVVGGYEHEFSHGYTFSGRFVYRHMRRIIEDISGINVTQNLAGVAQQYVVSNPSAKLDIFKNADPCTPGTKGCVTYDDPFNPGKLIGFTDIGDNPLGSDGRPDGFSNPVRIYKSMELSVSRRFSSGWQIYATYLLSKLYGNFEGSFRNDNGQSDPNISSLFDFTNTDGQLGFQSVPGVLPNDRRHQIKLFTNYTWKNLNLGLAWSIKSGAPLTALAAHPAYDNAGEIPIAGRGNLGRTEWTFPLDLHADYALKLGEAKRIKLVADLFNVTNQTRLLYINTWTQLNGATPNPDYLKPGTNVFAYPYQTPFNARLAVKFEF